MFHHNMESFVGNCYCASINSKHEHPLGNPRGIAHIFSPVTEQSEGASYALKPY